MEVTREKPRTTGKKSRKKGWKHSDIKDIEEHLEDERIEERQGGKASEKTDEALFFVDTDFSAQPQLTKKQKRRRERKENESDDDEQPFVSRKEKLRKKLESEEQKNVNEAKLELESAAKTNIWAEETAIEVDSYLESTVKPKKKVPASLLKQDPVLVDAIEVPNAGASYNPDYDDHQSLLQQANAAELAKLKKQNHLNKQVKLVTVDQLKKHAQQYIEEMSEGLAASKRDESDDDDSVEPNCLSDKVSVCPVSADDKKTQKERRRMEQEKEKERQKVLEKEEKSKLQDVFRLKTLAKEIKEEEQQSALRKQKKQKKIEMKKRLPKRVGKYKFEEKSIDVQLSEELTGTFRSFKPEGNLIADRFTSLQKRNLIEPRKPVQKHRKYRLKEYEKKSHKAKCIKEIKKTSNPK